MNYMKKSIFIIAATALVISCSSNDVKNEIVQEETPIGFSNINVGKKTKNAGEIINKTALEKENNTIKVWGWKTYNATPSIVFDGTTVTYNSAYAANHTTGWNYSPLKYWDFAASYDFYAVAPATKFSINASTKILTATSVEPVQILADNNGNSKVTTSSAIDYLVAATVHRNAPKGNATDGDVEFTFSHILSKLAVKVLTTTDFNNSGSNYPQIELTKLTVNIQGMCPTYTQKTAGAVNSSSTDGDTWSGTAAGSTPLYCYKTEGSVAALLLSTTATEVASYLVAPTATGATPATSTYTVDVEYDVIYSATANDSEHFVAAGKEIGTLNKFGQNTSNTLTITIAPQAIYFDVATISDWTNGLNGTVTIE